MIAGRANVVQQSIAAGKAEKQSFKDLLKKEVEQQEELKTIKSQGTPQSDTHWTNPKDPRYTEWKDETLYDNKIIKTYVQSSHYAEKLATSNSFNAFTIICIVIAGVNVGIQTYCPTEDEMEEDGIKDPPLCQFITGLDFWILNIFTAECLIKMWAEGLAPSQYFLGSEWAWNNFDFIIVVVCYPQIGGPLGLSDQVALLRLVRLMRVAKIVRKIPQLQVIVMGLVGGIKSIFYIVILLLIVFYIYAIAGVYAFRGNDPWHFGTLLTAMLTLFRCSTLEDWTDTMYINIYGCHRYPGGIYRQPHELPVSYGPGDSAVSSVSVFHSSRYDRFPDAACGDTQGRFVTFYDQGRTSRECMSQKKGLEQSTIEMSKWFCLDPAPNPYVSVLFFVTFVVVSALVMLSLFVGAVTMSMTSSMNQMKEESDKASRSKRLKRGSKRFTTLVSSVDGEAGGKSIAHHMSIREKQEEAQQRRIKHMLADALNGKELTGYNLKDEGDVDDYGVNETDTFQERMEKQYSKLATKCEKVAKDPRFGNAITLVIVVAGIMVGLQTDRKLRRYAGTAFLILDEIILVIFCFEFVLKVVAEEFQPLRYFDSKWNTFDFVVIFGSLLSKFSGGAVPTGMLTMLRLLRLLRVLKLVKSLPQLQVIVTALMMGLNSIGYIAIILFMFFYMFGILGIILFRDNDPWHFGTLHITFVTLFRCATLEDWTDVMYINIYGCDKYGYADSLVPGIGVGCETPKAQPLTVLYFLIFQVLGALVLLTLFIGVVTTAMEEATQDQKKAMTVEKRVKTVKDEMELSQQLVDLYREVFQVLDLDSGGKIEPDEIYTGLKLVGTDIPRDLLYDIFEEVDVDRGGQIDFSEFITFMFLLQKARMGQTKFGQRRMSSEELVVEDAEQVGGGGVPLKGTPMPDVDDDEGVANETKTDGGEEVPVPEGSSSSPEEQQQQQQKLEP